MEILEKAISEGRNALSEYESKQVLKSYHIPVTREKTVIDEKRFAGSHGRNRVSPGIEGLFIQHCSQDRKGIDPGGHPECRRGPGRLSKYNGQHGRGRRPGAGSGNDQGTAGTGGGPHPGSPVRPMRHVRIGRHFYRSVKRHLLSRCAPGKKGCSGNDG